MRALLHSDCRDKWFNYLLLLFSSKPLNSNVSRETLKLNKYVREGKLNIMFIWYIVYVEALKKLGDSLETAPIPVVKPPADCSQIPTFSPQTEDANNNCSQVCNMSHTTECVCTQPQEVSEGIAQEDPQLASDASAGVSCSESLCEQDLACPGDENVTPAETGYKYNATEQAPEYINLGAFVPDPQPTRKMVLNKTKIPRPAAITVHDRVTATVISVKTSFLERPPATVTTTLPPLVFRIPTTIVKISKPETVTRTIPPQVIYQPPIISTIHHKIQYPASTIVLNTILPPRVVTVPSPPLTVVKVLTKTVSPQTMTPKARFHRTMPSLGLNDNGINPSRIGSPFFGYAPEDYSLMYGTQNSGLWYGNNSGIDDAYSEMLSPPMHSLAKHGKTGYTEFKKPSQKDSYGLILPRLSNRNMCIQGTGDCYVSMMSSSFGQPQHEPGCSESNIMRCAQKYPDIIMPGDDPQDTLKSNRNPGNSGTSKTPKRGNVKTDSNRSLLVSGKSDGPRVVYMSELIENGE